MTDATSKWIAQWPTLRGATLVVSLQEPVPGERFVDIRRWHGEAGSDLVPGLQGITLAASELPDLRKALADMGVEREPGPEAAELPSGPPATIERPVPAAVADVAEADGPVPSSVARAEPVVGDEAVPDAPVPARVGRRGISRIWR